MLAWAAAEVCTPVASQFDCHPEQVFFAQARDLSEPRAASRILRRNNRAFGSLPFSNRGPPPVLLARPRPTHSFPFLVVIIKRYGGSSSTGRAPDCGSGRCGFDSRLPPQSFNKLQRAKSLRNQFAFGKAPHHLFVCFSHIRCGRIAISVHRGPDASVTHKKLFQVMSNRPTRLEIQNDLAPLGLIGPKKYQAERVRISNVG
jgi:hypothetical protein